MKKKLDLILKGEKVTFINEESKYSRVWKELIKLGYKGSELQTTLKVTGDTKADMNYTRTLSLPSKPLESKISADSKRTLTELKKMAINNLNYFEEVTTENIETEIQKLNAAFNIGLDIMTAMLRDLKAYYKLEEPKMKKLPLKALTPKNPEGNKFYSVNEAATKLNITPQKLRKHLRAIGFEKSPGENKYHLTSQQIKDLAEHFNK